ncbi:hypothetical protein R1flu_028653 [Riccia fluitans]|uniref:Uncharacterized protein n=1 Tax=Riccia fluitans TaxID=41844 RepID=A0ABD1XMD8_9MARC
MKGLRKSSVVLLKEFELSSNSAFWSSTRFLSFCSGFTLRKVPNCETRAFFLLGFLMVSFPAGPRLLQKDSQRTDLSRVYQYLSTHFAGSEKGKTSRSCNHEGAHEYASIGNG